ncbi:MAG: hypothetical protein A2V57_02935 [Candidatus Aminicenantes bacterium RBG_19FT_COMBO_65_30]|nr:MAG: hypothetical protein A2V57_02935 [Candidatus Aminicenantes bacterium RBG_19FT_COMBO_65_30]
MSSGRKGLKGYRPLPLLLFLVLLSRLSPAADIPYAWTGVERVVAVADLHGDYDSFVFILAHPEVGLVDGDLHWVGGKTHLVQLGDILDRGTGARKIFDRLMRLEKEAAAAGGMVHVLLGNHEEMNITGIALDYPDYVGVEQFVSFLPDDFREAKEAEYIKTLPPEERKRAEQDSLDVAVDEGLASYWRRIIARKDPEARRAYVLGFNATYGDWLIKKNTVIKINDVVYVHGGISEAFSKWPIREINAVMRSELEFFQAMMRSPQKVGRPFKPKIVYEPDSPLWFRGLGTKSERAAQAEIDRTLANLEARAMVVGHTLRFPGGSSTVVDRRNVARFQDKVWIMDTGISGSYGGVPSALIYERGEFRVWGETEEAAFQRSGIKPPAPRPLTPKEMADFLRTAAVTGRGPGPGGRTDAWKLTLESQGVVLPALFKYIDRRRPDPLADSYRYDLAAYALDKYLRLGYVPPIVERQVDEVPGGLQAFVGNAMSEADRKEKHIAPEDPEYFEKAMADLLVFQNLVYDDCRNEKDTLISRDDGKIYRVDFSEAFAPIKDDVPHCTIRKCSRLLYRKLQAWDDKTVAGYLGRYLNGEEVAALNARRQLVVRLIRMQIKVAGEANVLF